MPLSYEALGQRYGKPKTTPPSSRPFKQSEPTTAKSGFGDLLPPEVLLPGRLRGCYQIRKVRNSGTNYDGQEVLAASVGLSDWHTRSSVRGILLYTVQPCLPLCHMRSGISDLKSPGWISQRERGGTKPTCVYWHPFGCLYLPGFGELTLGLRVPGRLFSWSYGHSAGTEGAFLAGRQWVILGICK